MPTRAFQLTLPEDVAKQTGVTGHDASGERLRSLGDQWADFYAYFNFKTPQNTRHVRTLCGTALSWFFLWAFP